MSDPYRIPEPFVVSFSGGSTSGFMLRRVLDAYGGSLPSSAVVVFCNTGLEHERTLDFVHEIEARWCPVVWLEYDPLTRFRVVDYSTASRDGEPFRALIDARGYLPTPVARVCTTNLKIRASSSYLKSIGWQSWSNAIGLRYDEPHRVHRMKGDIKAEDPVMPMYEAMHSLKDVDDYWGRSDFALGIPRWLGNCVGCFLKSRGRLEMVAESEPEHLEWWERQEERFGKSFRLDRTYRGIRLQVLEQGRLYDDAGDSMPCMCGD